MMRIKAFREFGGQPFVFEASVLLVEREDGTPFMVAADSAPGFIAFAHAKDEDFNRILKGLGFDRLVICETLDDKLQHPDNLPTIIPESQQ